MPLYQQHVSGLPEEICYAPEPVQVPSSWRQSSQEFRIEKYGFDPFHMFEYPAIWDEAESGVLHRVVTLEKDQIGQRLVLQFNGIFQKAYIYWNGEMLAETQEAYLLHMWTSPERDGREKTNYT